MVTIKLNGEPLNLPCGSSVTQLLELAEMNDKLVAVEVNRDVVPKSHHASCVLQAGDQVEVVTLVGGG